MSYLDCVCLELITKCGTDVETFVNAISAEKEKDEGGPAAFALQVLCSVTEYTNFIDMMREYKNKTKE